MKRAKGEKISLSSQLRSRVEVLQVAWMTRAFHRSLTVLISPVMQRNLQKLPSETGDGPSPITEEQVKCISISFKEKLHTFAGLILNAGKREHALRSGEISREAMGFKGTSMNPYNRILH